jgi:hypothetical protein
MLSRLKKLLTEAGSVPAFDASLFNDPLALTVDWGPVQRGGTNFRTHKLDLIDFQRIEFRPTLAARAFYFLFILVGLGISTGFTILHIKNGGMMFDTNLLLTVAMGMAFTGIGSYLYYAGARPVVFDKRSGYFWRCWKAPDKAFHMNAMDDYTPLDKIHAIQLIKEFVRGDKRSYFSYELILVLKDGSRLLVVDHGSKEKLREDAATLSDFLKKPVWDAI